MKSYSSRELIFILTEAGWRLHKVVGSHHHFVHSERKGKVTVPHPQKDMPFKTLKSIFMQAGIDWRQLN